MQRASALSAVLCLLVACCARRATAAISNQAGDYLAHVLDLMQSTALHRKEIDWPALRIATLRQAAEANSTSDTYPAVAYACTQLMDHGSYLIEPAATPAQIQAESSQRIRISQQALHGRQLIARAGSPFSGRRLLVLATLNMQHRRFAYIVIPSSRLIHAEDDAPGPRHKLAESLFSLILKGTAQGVHGWILDLRGNAKGHVQDMPAALSALLGEGKVLTLRGPDSSQELRIHGAEVVEHTGFRHTWVDEHLDENVRLNQEQAPVAILVDRATRGAGESLAIAFKGRPNTYFLGERTGGATEWGPHFLLPDGAILAIMSEQVFDRHREAYPEGLQPDQEVEAPSTIPKISEDPLVLAAQNWLLGQP